MKVNGRNGLRLLVVGVLAASTVTLTSPNANAAVKVVTRCKENAVAVPRCLDIRYDNVNHRFRASAGIIDAPGGANYDVDVYSLEVSGTFGGTAKVSEPGYNPDGDTLRTVLVPCSSQTIARAVVLFRWRNAATGAKAAEYMDLSAIVCN